MSTPLSSIVLFLLAAVLGALGQFLYKGGADAAQGGLLSYLTNVRILLGIVCHCAVMFLFVAAFKRGGSLAVLYPLYASTFIFAALNICGCIRDAHKADQRRRHALAGGWYVLHGSLRRGKLSSQGSHDQDFRS